MPLGAHKAAIMGVAGASAAGDVVLIETISGTGVSDFEFDSGIDSTYAQYIFGIYNINPSANGVDFKFHATTDGTNYTVPHVHSYFKSEHSEDDDDVQALAYDTSYDSLNVDGNLSVIAIPIMREIGNGADESGSGILHLWNPASTTFMKHYQSECINNNYTSGSIPNVAHHSFVGGYFNTTSAITKIKFTLGSGTMDGKIKLWGVK